MMKELVKTIDPELKYVKHVTNDEMIQIHVRLSRKKVNEVSASQKLS